MTWENESGKSGGQLLFQKINITQIFISNIFETP